jgi:methionyl-tRNA formyltransferase
MLSEYAHRYPNHPAVPTLEVSNVNALEVLAFCQAQNPSLMVVSGTSLVRAPLLTMPLSIGMVNLHTGLSPYVKGGPNCTNWCLAEGRPELIGSTVMWIDAGIDTGSIITSARPDLSHISSLLELHQTVMRHAHLLLLDAVQRITSSGKAAVPAVPQSNFLPGRTYYTREWTAKMRYRAVRNFLRGDLLHIAARPTPATVPLAVALESE